jgi:2-C-methyl-D-erythritol 4-phosphate cytidylyltransferase/2-C-methyl-D-erythritol 2,4-cyclodiphosphate synthase
MVDVVVPAAGSGSRMGANVKKTYIEVAGRPLLAHTLDRLSSVPDIRRIWLVVAPEDVDYCRHSVIARHAIPKIASVLEGGATRQESVYRGLQAIPLDVETVLVHDGARPGVSADVIRRVVEGVAETGAATAAIPVKDTLRRADADGFAGDGLDRANLWRIQTPQGFRRALILEAHRRASERGIAATDDACLVELLGVRVRLVLGDERDVKVTTPDDIALVEPLLASREHAAVEIRTGIGYDIHQLVAGRRLVLGGVTIPHEKGLLGHSDADALAHALCDALLGAAGLGDIGTHFPDTDAQFRDADSMNLLRKTVALVSARFRVLNVDATVKAQEPRLNPYVGAIRERLASALGIAVDRVNVKAKTGERLGPVGEGRAIETEAVATLMRL